MPFSYFSSVSVAKKYLDSFKVKVFSKIQQFVFLPLNKPIKFLTTCGVLVVYRFRNTDIRYIIISTITTLVLGKLIKLIKFLTKICFWTASWQPKLQKVRCFLKEHFFCIPFWKQKYQYSLRLLCNNGEKTIVTLLIRKSWRN